MKEMKEEKTKPQMIKEIETIHQYKLKMVSNIYDQIEERKKWIAILNGDIDECLRRMEELK